MGDEASALLTTSLLFRVMNFFDMLDRVCLKLCEVLIKIVCMMIILISLHLQRTGACLTLQHVAKKLL